MKKRIWGCSFLFVLCVSMLIHLPSMGEEISAQSAAGISENVISEADAIALSQEMLSEKYELFENLTANGRAFASFEAKAEEPEPIWLVEFENSEWFQGKFRARLSAQGSILLLEKPAVSDGFRDADTSIPAVLHEYDISMEQAKQNAMEAIQETYDPSAQEMSQYRVDAFFVYDHRFCNGWEPVWLIHAYQDERLAFQVLLGYEGSFIDIASGDQEFENTIRKGLYIEDAIGVNFSSFHFYEMSHWERAAFSKKWNPILDQYVTQHPYCRIRNDALVKVTRNVYGVPDDRHISQTEAEERARQAAILLGADADGIYNRKLELYFDITIPDSPRWNIVVGYDLPHDNYKAYRVVLDAITGDVLEAFRIDENMKISDYRM